MIKMWIPFLKKRTIYKSNLKAHQFQNVVYKLILFFSGKGPERLAIVEETGAWKE